VSTYRETCYADDLAAASAMCGTEWPKSFIDATTSKVQSCIVIDASHLQLSTFDSAASSVAVTTVPVAFTTCDPSQPFTDHLELWGLGVMLCMLIWAARASVRPIVGDF